MSISKVLPGILSNARGMVFLASGVATLARAYSCRLKAEVLKPSNATMRWPFSRSVPIKSFIASSF